MSRDSRAKNSTVGRSNDNWTSTFLAVGLKGERVTSARWDSRASTAGGATKIIFSVFARASIER
jgi:hypothetical protein